MPHPVIIIPARMQSVRLPGKPLADIHGQPMIVRVLERVGLANLCPAYVACDGEEIKQAVETGGGKAVLTRSGHPSGTDRIHEAVNAIDPEKQHDWVINVQGDLPTLDPALITACTGFFDDPNTDIGTFVVAEHDEAANQNPNVVKAILEGDGPLYEAVDFTREPQATLPIHHHVGLYVYRREALERFCSLPPSEREIARRLEQLRALDNGMTITAQLLEAEPHSVDTPEDLEKARELWK